MLRGNKQQVKGNLILKKEKICVLKVEIIQLHHNILVVGYKVGDKKLLVTRDNKRCWKIYR